MKQMLLKLLTLLVVIGLSACGGSGNVNHQDSTVSVKNDQDAITVMGLDQEFLIEQGLSGLYLESLNPEAAGDPTHWKFQWFYGDNLITTIVPMDRVQFAFESYSSQPSFEITYLEGQDKRNYMDEYVPDDRDPENFDPNVAFAPYTMNHVTVTLSESDYSQFVK